MDNSKIESNRLKDRISVLESTIDSTTADRKEIERQLTNTREEVSGKQIEISRLTTLLENARSKIDEMEQDRALGDKSHLQKLLDVARKEKEDKLKLQADYQLLLDTTNQLQVRKLIHLCFKIFV